MCVSPLTIWIGKGADSRQVETACRKCWQCRSNAIADWVGRNIAESRTAMACHAVTLTYGRDARFGSVDHERAVLLTYSDVQNWLKLLRFHGYPVRYFITGEFGGLKGRAHWHVMLYWQKKVPELQVDKHCVVQNHWDHGFSFYTEPNYKQIWYNCKYIQKGQGETDQRVQPRMSKKPPLGAQYFKSLAWTYATQGLAPQSLDYTFPEIRRGRRADGEHYRFRLQGRSAELFLDEYMRAWTTVHGAEQRPASLLVDEFEEWGRVINPETFHYIPEPQGRVSRPDPRGPVTLDDERRALVASRRAYEMDLEREWDEWFGEKGTNDGQSTERDDHATTDACPCADCTARRDRARSSAD